MVSAEWSSTSQNWLAISSALPTMKRTERRSGLRGFAALLGRHAGVDLADLEAGTGEPVAEIRAVLAHEVARRRDQADVAAGAQRLAIATRTMTSVLPEPVGALRRNSKRPSARPSLIEAIARF